MLNQIIQLQDRHVVKYHLQQDVMNEKQFAILEMEDKQYVPHYEIVVEHHLHTIVVVIIVLIGIIDGGRGVDQKVEVLNLVLDHLIGFFIY